MVFFFEFERHDSRKCPVGSKDLCVGSLSTVGDIVAHTLVHGVVVYQSHLIASETFFTIGVADKARCQGSVPQPCLHHATCVVLVFWVLSVNMIGSSEDELSCAGVGLVHDEGTDNFSSVQQG